MTAQRLRVLANVHREHLPKQGGCRPVGQQSGELRPQPIQLRRRAGVRRPFHACPTRAAASTAEAGQPDRDLAEQRGDRVLAIVLHAANALAIPAPRPPHGVVPGLRGDNLPLDARQHQLRFGQGQTQIGDVDEAIGPANLHDVCARPLAFRPDFHQPQNPSHVSTLGQRTSAEYPTAVAPPISRRSLLWAGGERQTQRRVRPLANLGRRRCLHLDLGLIRSPYKPALLRSSYLWSCLVRLNRVAWVGGVHALSPTRVAGYAMRTYSGRPKSNMRFRTLVAMATSVACRPSVCERSPPPITHFQRAISASTRARQLYPDARCQPMRPRSAIHRRCRSRCVGAVPAVSLGTAFARGGTITAAAGWRAATSA